MPRRDVEHRQLQSQTLRVMAVIGLVPTVAIFVIVFMRYENKEPRKLVIIYAELKFLPSI